jgi:hypothetical protein
MRGIYDWAEAYGRFMKIWGGSIILRGGLYFLVWIFSGFGSLVLEIG